MARAPARPKQIPLKKWKGYAPSYKKRLANFYKKHPGETLQRARGKKAAEHVTRKERENEKMRRYAEAQAFRGGKDPKVIYDKLDRMRSERGMRQVSRLIEHTDALHKEYMARGQPNRHSPDYMDYDLADDLEFYDLDEDERRYH